MPGSSRGSGPTFYETLGVEEDASTAEVRAAYRERAKDTHPDVSDAPDAARRFKQVKRAHEVLSDERERRRYDRLGHRAYVALDDPGRSAAGDTASASSPPEEAASDASGGWTAPGERSYEEPGRGSAGSEATGRRRRSGSGRTNTDGRRHRAGGGRSRSRGGGPRGTGPGTRVGRGPRRGATVAEEDSFGRVAYGVARWLGLVGVLVRAWQSRLGPAGAATALATFAAYPVLLASTVTPLFPLAINLLVGFCTFGVLGYLVLRPAIGVAVLGAWMLVLPFALTVSGVGVLSVGGLYSLVVTVIPLVLCVATLASGSV